MAERDRQSEIISLISGKRSTVAVLNWLEAYFDMGVLDMVFIGLVVD